MGYGYAYDDDCMYVWDMGSHCGVGLHGMGRVALDMGVRSGNIRIYVYLNPREPPDELDLPYLAYPLIL